MQEEEERTQASRAVLPQVLLICMGNVAAMSYGMSHGHSAVLLPQLQSENSTLPIDTDTGSWIASAYAISSPVGCLLGGLTLDLWGRRSMNVIGNIGMAIGWLLIAFAQNPTMLIYGRITEGFSRSLLATSFVVFADELAHPKYRGFILCSTFTFVSVGIMTISSLGAFVDWRSASALAALPSVITIILLYFLHESPTWFVRRNRMAEAERALQWLWGPGNLEQARKELDGLRARLHPREQSCQTPLLSRRIRETVGDIFKPRILKPFFILHIFNILQVPCGLSILTYYTVDILSKTRNDETQVMDDYSNNVIISGVRLIATLISTVLMLRAGRRTLAMISGILSSLSALCLGIILSLSTTKFGSTISPQLEANVTFALIIIYAGGMSFGFFALPSVMIGETQPSHIRGFACGYIYTMNDLLLGGFLKLYPWMSTTLQIHGLFLLFGISCAVCTIFLYFFLPETQGLTLQQIEDYFLQPNIMWITRHRYQNERKQTEDVDIEMISKT